MKVWSHRIEVKVAHDDRRPACLVARTLPQARKLAAEETRLGYQTATIYHTAKGGEVIARYRNGEEE